ncbi:MAG: hypothetical protein AMJ94_11730 [Deltaproteobacteria bacterium SM23_61]|nr:MAG: hypothetical protein AMJ94_11730 [Deltaproteobacteria bacterium SM23_61]
MSFIITLYVREGIVMASDSRLTLNATQQQGPNQTVLLAVGQSDSNYKIFLASTNVGISTYRAADIQGVPIGGYVESFIHDVLEPQRLGVDQAAKELLIYFRAFQPPPDTQFHVAGYVNAGGITEPHIMQVSIVPNQVVRLNPPGQQGASWGGESDVLARLIYPVAQVNQQGQIVAQLPFHPIPWNFLTLQDAIDFAIFAIGSTINAMRFQPRPKTVGGPIDVLVIKPNGAFWVQRKELRAI